MVPKKSFWWGLIFRCSSLFKTCCLTLKCCRVNLGRHHLVSSNWCSTTLLLKCVPGSRKFTHFPIYCLSDSLVQEVFVLFYCPEWAHKVVSTPHYTKVLHQYWPCYQMKIMQSVKIEVCGIFCHFLSLPRWVSFQLLSAAIISICSLLVPLTFWAGLCNFLIHSLFCFVFPNRLNVQDELPDFSAITVLSSHCRCSCTWHTSIGFLRQNSLRQRKRFSWIPRGWKHAYKPSYLIAALCYDDRIKPSLRKIFSPGFN